MTNTHTINAQEFAVKVLRKQAVKEIKLMDLTSEFETATYDRKKELQAEAKIVKAEIDTYRDVVSDLVASPKWRILTLKTMMAEMLVDSL